jgi:hypothetical protein
LCFAAPPPAAASGTAFAGGVAVATPDATDVTDPAARAELPPEPMTDEPAVLAE